MRVDCELEDLLSDASFRKWALHQDAESALFWENWLQQNPAQKETVAQAMIMLKSLQFEESTISEEESKQLLERIRKTNSLLAGASSRETIIRPINSHVARLQDQQNKRKNSYRNLLAYAAIIAAALLFAVSVHLISAEGDESVEAGVQLVEKSNKKGQKAILYLPDGSKVVLNASSTLRYPKEFSEEVREVFLKGEAFFEVSKSSTPFVVRTEKLEARVLGTSFNISAFPETKEHKVALLTGKVQVHARAKEEGYVVLAPGEQVKLDSEVGKLIKSKLEDKDEVAWKEGVLLFKDQPLEEALERLEQWYGVEFVTGPLPEKDFFVTGKFNNESLDNVLSSIGFTIKFEHQIKGNKVYLKFHK